MSKNRETFFSEEEVSGVGFGITSLDESETYLVEGSHNEDQGGFEVEMREGVAVSPGQLELPSKYVGFDAYNTLKDRRRRRNSSILS